MATIKERGNSYLIRVSCGYDINGNHKEQAMTWKPEPGMIQRQIDKELNRQAVMFEEACMHGYKASAVKFEALSEEWLRSMQSPISAAPLTSVCSSSGIEFILR